MRMKWIRKDGYFVTDDGRFTLRPTPLNPKWLGYWGLYDRDNEQEYPCRTEKSGKDAARRLSRNEPGPVVEVEGWQKDYYDNDLSPYSQGTLAEKAEENPYPINSEEYDEWNSGFVQQRQLDQDFITGDNWN
jgi:hypothetical protein